MTDMDRTTRVDDFGPQHLTAEDTAYAGSRCADVRDAIFANPYQIGHRVLGAGAAPAWRPPLGVESA